MVLLSGLVLKELLKPIQFDASNPLHMGFVFAAANLRAVTFGLKPEANADAVKKISASVTVPHFTPKKVKISVNENEEKEKAKQQEETKDEDEEDQSKKILSELPAPSKLAGYKLTAIDFEKDDDTNYHMDFITATANLRATNYAIPIADKHKVKGIAGKIIPAMVTTTALVCGLVCIELLKLIQNKKLDDYKNGFVNLALPFFGFSEPLQPQKTKIRENWTWNLWDRFNIDGDITLQEFLNYFKEKHQLEVTMISCGVSMIYSFFLNKDKLAERLPMKISQVVALVSKQPLSEKKRSLTFEICVNRIEDDEDVDVPYVLLKF